jgi:hypothetical protein
MPKHVTQTQECRRLAAARHTQIVHTNTLPGLAAILGLQPEAVHSWADRLLEADQFGRPELAAMLEASLIVTLLS